MKTFKLKDGNEIPFIGFGTWRLNGDECIKAVKYAIEAGYRHIDTAELYGNHKEVGLAIKSSGVKREDLFITTKIPPHDLSYNSVIESCYRYLKELEIEYIDLLLIHWPNKKYPIGETLSGMQKLKSDGKIRSIGVSNFTIHHLEDTKETIVEVVNNQVEMHIEFNQKELREYCKNKGIIITAYSPLGRGNNLDNPVLIEISKIHNATPSQVALSWINSKEVIAIPKSSKPARIKENFDSQNIKLSDEEIAKIDAIPQKDRTVVASWNEFSY